MAKYEVVKQHKGISGSSAYFYSSGGNTYVVSKKNWKWFDIFRQGTPKEELFLVEFSGISGIISADSLETGERANDWTEIGISHCIYKFRREFVAEKRKKELNIRAKELEKINAKS